MFVNEWNENMRLPDVLWPGGDTQVPRGWVIPQNGRPLQIGVPTRAGYKELIRETTDSRTNTTTFHGFCINVFEAAVRYLPYAVTYEFIVTAGNANDTPVYDNLIARLANQVLAYIST
jgi:ionotropic glutamate receptor